MRNVRVFGLVSVLAFVLIMSGWAGQAQAQAKYPTRAITIICGFAPGGAVDMAARAMTPYLSKKWGVPVNVVNKPGGNTIPATLEVYSSAPDGYTMLADGQPMCTLMEVAVPDLPFKINERTFIAITAMTPLVTIVSNSSPYKNLNDLIADARKDTANFTWDSAGGVSGDDFLGRMIFKAGGIDVSKTKVVMIKGGAEAARLVAGGHIKMGNPGFIAAWPHIQAKTIKPLAVALKERYELLPNVPTHVELGYPSIVCPFWLGVSGPPKMPAHIIDIWNKTILEMMKDAEYLQLLKRGFFTPFYHSAKEMREYIQKEVLVAKAVYTDTGKK